MPGPLRALGREWRVPPFPPLPPLVGVSSCVACPCPGTLHGGKTSGDAPQLWLDVIQLWLDVIQKHCGNGPDFQPGRPA